MSGVTHRVTRQATNLERGGSSLEGWNTTPPDNSMQRLGHNRAHKDAPAILASTGRALSLPNIVLDASLESNGFLSPNGQFEGKLVGRLRNAAITVLKKFPRQTVWSSGFEAGSLLQSTFEFNPGRDFTREDSRRILVPALQAVPVFLDDLLLTANGTTHHHKFSE